MTHQLITILKITVIIATFSVIALSENVTAQSVQPRPVARLISSSRSVENSDYNRPPVNTRAPNAKSNRKSVAYPELADANLIERRAFEETNSVREKNGLSPLVWEAELFLMARQHSESMARLGYFGHETPAGMRLRDRARAAGIDGWRVLAENIAYNQGYNDPGAFAVERWLISPGHRANILSNEFRGVAIGSHVAADGRVYLTQVFISAGRHNLHRVAACVFQ